MSGFASEVFDFVSIIFVVLFTVPDCESLLLTSFISSCGNLTCSALDLVNEDQLSCRMHKWRFQLYSNGRFIVVVMLHEVNH